MGEVSLLGIFTDESRLIDAVAKLREGHFRIEKVFSPFMSPEVLEVMERRPSMVRLLTLIGGLTGALGILALASWAHTSFSLITSGKPVLPAVPWVVISFEWTVLFGSLFSFVSWIFKGGLPATPLPDSYGPAFSGDRFGLVVTATEKERASLEELLDQAGAEEVRLVAS